MNTNSQPDVFRLALENQSNLLTATLESFPDLVKAKDPNSDSRTALHHAASSGSLQAVQVLVEHGAEIDARDGMGFTPLMCGVSAGNIDVVNELLGGTPPANVNLANERGLTPLHYAASKGRTELGKLLIAKEADINAKDRANQLPIHRAASIGATPFIQLITSSKSQKARLNQVDRGGSTPLMLAIESGHGTSAVALIEAGADRQRMNAEGLRAEEMPGVGGQEHKRVLQYIESFCGKLE